mmetsp:Transcript_3667/g.5419  ORF Transcript_3667/g.5419 Transcript_3667/m.5419 type:complete len:850 (+) Transcript_3667:23-2572(+)
MGSLWRSEDMILIEMTMQREAVHDTVEALGEAGIVQFNDVSPDLNAFERQYAKSVKRCEELERKLRFFETEIAKSDVKSSYFQGDQGRDAIAHSSEFDEVTIDSLTDTFSNYETELRSQNNTLERLRKEKCEHEELTQVLKRTSTLLSNVDNLSDDIDVNPQQTPESSLLSYEGTSGITGEAVSGPSIGHVTGVINRDKIPHFMMIIYRTTRGLAIPRFMDIKEPLYDATTKEYVDKSVFIIVSHSAQMNERIRSMCTSFGASIYNVTSTMMHNVDSTEGELHNKVTMLDNTIHTTERARNDILSEISTVLQLWKKKVVREKAIFHTMNLFNYRIKGSVIAEGWCPEKSLNRIQQIMNSAVTSSHSQVQSYVTRVATKAEPPTHFELNDFTACFQALVNSYGIPRYQELNPGVINIITFPFLFAVMFGDYGHGLILFAFSAIICLAAPKLKKIAKTNELVGMLVGSRFLLLFMGLFAIFTGLLYNDCFSLALDWFGTSYEFDEATNLGYKKKATYAFGVDPAWYGTENKLTFYNSLKMKMSIVYGVVHMLVGIFLGASNHIYFKHFSHLIFEFIPEVFILSCTFGYMSIMILIKWCIDWEKQTTAPPSILNTMTDFFLKFYLPMAQPKLFPYQDWVQRVLLVLAGVSIPLLLFPIPIMEIIKAKRERSKAIREQQASHATPDIIADPENDDLFNDQEDVLGVETEVDIPEVVPTEIFIKQMIHTIEFVLGTVSNTASYLRLWALSLAHAQLSEVFWEMTIGVAMGMSFPTMPWLEKVLINSGLLIFITYIPWILFTIGVLLGMEALSAFLHCLRLHWVEFQNKFFYADGWAFEPFSFEQIFDDLIKQEE